MDPLTHTLVGVGLADAGLRERTPLAAATLLIGANLPDVDAVTYFLGNDLSLGFRRGWTHGVLAFAVLPLLLVGGVLLYDRLWRRRRRPSLPPASAGQLTLLAYLAFATHPFLDWLNTYGIRLLMPFDGRWFYGDTLFIVDPWLWLVLGGAAFLAHSRGLRAVLAWGALATLMSAAVLGVAPWPARVAWLAGLAVLIGARIAFSSFDQPLRRSRLARASLAVASGYVALLFVSSAAAEREIRAELAQSGAAPLADLMVGPVAANPLRRDVIAVTPAGYRFGTYDFLARPRFQLEDASPPRLEQLRRVHPTVVDATLQAPCLQGMVTWMRYPVMEIDDSGVATGDGVDVLLSDVRYARHGAGFASSHVHLEPGADPVCGE